MSIQAKSAVQANTINRLETLLGLLKSTFITLIGSAALARLMKMLATN